MVDTVILRILNLSKYPKLYEQYFAPSKKKNSSTIMVTDYDTGEVTERAQSTVYVYHDTDRCLPLVHRSNINLSSSHYSVAYSLQLAGDYMEFNFSIPKYLFATNVMQFINLYDQSSNVMFIELIKFIFTFIKENCIQEPLSDDIEINRIDFCYNQFFNSKEDALLYLDEQKKLLVKYARSSKNNFRTYDTSLMYVTNRYSFKIYHKGTEFLKNDLKELVKSGGRGLPADLRDYHMFNQKNGLQYLQEQADCVLRYEMTFRRNALNYLTNHYFFVSKKAVLYAEYSQHVLSRTFRALLAVGGRRHGYDQNSQSLYEKYRKKHKKFTLKSVFDHTDDLFLLYDADNITFDNTIFGILHRQFYKKINDYQLVNRVLSPHDIVKKLENSNEELKAKNLLRSSFGRPGSKTKVSKDLKGKNVMRLLTVAMLLQHMKLDELKKYLPQSTYYDLKRDLKKTGITSNDVDINVPKPRLDYFDYKLYFQKFHN